MKLIGLTHIFDGNMPVYPGDLCADFLRHLGSLIGERFDFARRYTTANFFPLMHPCDPPGKQPPEAEGVG